jgi:predicted transcriptional regulator
MLGSKSALIEEGSNEKMDESRQEELSISELISNLQRIKSEERKLIEQKQEFSSKEKELRRMIVQEILKKEKKMQELEIEIQNLQNQCYRLTQALHADIPSEP